LIQKQRLLSKQFQIPKTGQDLLKPIHPPLLVVKYWCINSNIEYICWYL